MSGHHALQQVLKTRAGGRGHRDRVAVATKPPGQPHDVDQLAFGARVTGTELDGPHQRAPRQGDVRQVLRCARRRLDHRCQLSLDVAVQVPFVAVAGDEARPGEPGERVRDRRALGAHQPAEQLVGEWQRQPDPTRLDPSPPRCQVPQHQRQPHLEPRLRGDRPLHVEVARPALSASQQRLHQLRPRLHALGERGIEHREPHRQ